MIDGDPNRSASKWLKRGELPFKVIDERQAAQHAGNYKHIVIDTEARPDDDDLTELAECCDLLVFPTTPDAMAIDALTLIVNALKKQKAERYRILLTIIPPKPNQDGEEARNMLIEQRLPVFEGEIHRFIAFQKASLAGVPVYKVDDQRAKQGWSEYVTVGREILPCS